MRTWDKLALVFVAIVALCAVLITALTNVADRQLAASQAKVRESERVAFYERLAKAEEAPIAQPPDAQAPPQTTANAADPIQIARDTITAYTELFAKVSAWANERERDQKPLIDKDTTTNALDIPQELIEQIIETAKRGGPVCLLDFTTFDGLDMKHQDKVLQCAMLVKEYASAKLASGEDAEALRGFMAAFDLADALSWEPLALSFWTRTQIYRSAMEVIDATKLSSELAKALFERLSKADNREALHEVLAGELQVDRCGFEYWKKRSLTETVSQAGLYWGTRSWLWATPICRPWFDKDQQVTIDMVARMMEIENRPYYKAKTALDLIRADADALSVANMAVKPRIMWRLDMFKMQAIFEMELDVTQLQIAIEQHHRTHGNYPETLDAISDWFGGTAPLNPFEGKPYGYNSDGKTYSLDMAERLKKIREMARTGS